MSRIDSDLQKALKKACSVEETAPKRKHVRACIVYTWDHQSSKAVFTTLKTLPLANDEVQLFKMLIVLHKIIQEGHPSALAEAIRDREWMRSLGRVHSGGSSYSKLIREYVRYLVLKLDFHAQHRGFNNGTFEYEEYVSLVSVSDPDEGYETILDLMSLQDSLDEFSQIIFASIQSERRNTECKISALIPLIAESYGIYKFITSMLRAMHRQLNDAEGDAALQPLKERYELQHARLFEFYADCSSVKYLTTLVTIPKLPVDAPDVFVINDVDESKEIKFQRKREASRTPARTPTPTPPVVVEPAVSPRPASRRTTSTPTGYLQAMSTGATTAMMIPTVTGAANAMFPQTTAQMQPDFWANQQAQFANEQNRLEQERLQQLQEQQAQQEQFQQQLQNAQQDMMSVQLQQQNQHQNDLIALTNQYEKDQALLQQYDQRVQQLENEIATMDSTASKQLANKDEQLAALQDQLDVWERKYDSLGKLYSQLRQEHLNLLPRFKKLQLKVNSAQESIQKKEQLEQKLKQKDLQMAELVKDRDRARLELERSTNNADADAAAAAAAAAAAETMSGNKMSPILDAILESGINTIQESVYNLDSPLSWSGPLTPPTFLLSLLESTSENATEFATSFNNLIVDGLVRGDQTEVIRCVSEFSTSMATLVTNSKAYAVTTLPQEQSDQILTLVKRCAREAQYFFEDLMSENLNQLGDEEKTDIVINANVDMQEKLQELSLAIEPLLNMQSVKSNKETNPHSELVATADKIVKSSQHLRVDVPKPLLSLALLIIDAVVALVKAAIQCQNEIATTTSIPLNQFYLKNSRWTEGLISAAKAVANATNVLISTASNLITSEDGGNTSPEQFIVASKEVAASTIQLVAASRVKTSIHSKAQDKLEHCSKDVTDACKSLGNHVMGLIEDEHSNSQQQQPLEFTSEHTLKTVEMEQQVEILKLEQSLSNARKRLGEIRRHAYYNQDDDQ
ncbi:hypothetical protein SKDZ_14G0860 [Saccharomyces kudriavzevii ZP591]|nr:hypothetical protein SKDZ_14G0860 [Saccharomyces kudriavzevii ZP591]